MPLDDRDARRYIENRIIRVKPCSAMAIVDIDFEWPVAVGGYEVHDYGPRSDEPTLLTADLSGLHLDPKSSELERRRPLADEPYLFLLFADTAQHADGAREFASRIRVAARHAAQPRRRRSGVALAAPYPAVSASGRHLAKRQPGRAALASRPGRPAAGLHCRRALLARGAPAPGAQTQLSVVGDAPAIFPSRRRAERDQGMRRLREVVRARPRQGASRQVAVLLGPMPVRFS